MLKLRFKYIMLIVMTAAMGATYGQTKVKLKQADRLIGGIDREGNRFDRFVGNVIFEQNETTIYCDSAILFKQENRVKAFGHVKITDGDSVKITSKKLTYTGNNKRAQLRENVIFEKLNGITLYTDFLDYDRLKQQAKYFNGGKLVDSVNVLTSEKGYYQVNTDMASFKKKVVGKNPDYTLRSDTLQYNTATDIVYFRDSTELTDTEGNVFLYKEGEYNTNIRQSNLTMGEIETVNYTLTGDRLFLDDIRKLYRAEGHVEMISKEEDIIITGDYSLYQKDKGIAKVYGRALMKKPMKADTLYMTADTLVAIEHEDPAKKRLLAYRHVKIYKSDLQGKSDSLAYLPGDSILFLYDDPVLWNEGNQMTADSINMVISHGTIDRMHMDKNAFVISTDSIDNFNQVKGRKMVARFDSGRVKRVDVTGNGESLYFALNDEETELIGMNKIFCSAMTINFKVNKADNISFYVEPDAQFIPPHELQEPEKRLKNFSWRPEEKPLKEELLARDQHTSKEGANDDPIPAKTDKVTPEKESETNR